MAKIELNHYDLEVRTIKNKDGDELEIVSLNSRLAFDPSFIEEMKGQGVRPVVKRDDSGENVDE